MADTIFQLSLSAQFSIAGLSKDKTTFIDENITLCLSDISASNMWIRHLCHMVV